MTARQREAYGFPSLPAFRDMTERNGWHHVSELHGYRSQEEAAIVDLLREGEGTKALAYLDDRSITGLVAYGPDAMDLSADWSVYYTERGAPIADAASLGLSWRRDHTGGGCTAFRLDLDDLDDGRYVLLTDGNQTAPTHDHPALVAALYIGDGPDYDDRCFTGNLAACLAWADALASGDTIESVDLDQSGSDTIFGSEWSSTLADFLIANEEDEETRKTVLALAPGESVLLGGGAGVLTRVKRIGGAK